MWSTRRAFPKSSARPRRSVPLPIPTVFLTADIFQGACGPHRANSSISLRPVVVTDVARPRKLHAEIEIMGPGKAIVFTVIVAVMAGRAMAGDLPDSKLTPGLTNPDVNPSNIRQTICVKGWSGTVRPPQAYTDELKKTQMVEYGYADRNPPRLRGRPSDSTGSRRPPA
jgi:hypothetical protein